MTIAVKVCSLSKALSYQNDDVVYRFTQLYNISFEDANEIFGETKKWLWLTAQARAHGITTQLSIKDALLIVDEMWHNFILFTDDYSHYCFDHFGYFLHHKPAKQSARSQYQKSHSPEKLSPDPKQFTQKQITSLKQQCKFICEQLGSDTLLKWFVEFPQRYDADFFNHQRHQVSLGWSPTQELQILAAHIKTRKVVITT